MLEAQRRMLKHIIYVVVLFPLTVFSQDLQYSQYDLSEGLPSNETYFTYQDSMGYIWVGTDRGLARFDGNEFEVFTTSNSNLTYNTIFKVFSAPNGELWFTCYDKSITIYNVSNQEFRPFKHNDSLKLWSRYWVSDINFKQGKAFIYNLYDMTGVIVADCDEKQIKRLDWSDVVMESFNPRLFIEDFSGGDRTQGHICDRQNSHPYVWFETEKHKFCAHWSELVGGRMMFSYYGGLYEWDGEEDHRIAEFGSRETINHFYPDHRGRILISTTLGLYILDNGNLRKLLTGGYTYVSQDAELNYWVSTADNGVQKIPLIQSGKNLYRLSHSKVTAIQEVGQWLAIGTNKEEIWYIGRGDTSFRLCMGPISVSAPEERTNRYRMINSMNRGNNRVMCTLGIELVDEGSKLGYKKTDLNIPDQGFEGLPKFHGFNINHGLYLRDGSRLTTYHAPYMGHGVVQENGEEGEVYYSSDITEVVTSMDESPDGVVWISSLNGVWKILKGDRQKAIRLKGVEPLRGRVNQVTHACRNTIIFATDARGVVLLNGNDTVQLTVENGLISNTVNCISMEGDSVLWVGTNKGLSRVVITQKLTGSFVDYNLNTDDGLWANFVMSMKVWDGKLWLGTDGGLQSLRLKELYKKQACPKMILQDISVLQREESGMYASSFRYNQNNLSIKYIGISFRKPSENFYRYRLIHDGRTHETEFRYTNNNSVDLFNLQSGDYVFEIACRDKNNNWSETKRYTYTIVPHFSDTWWFKGTIFGGILAVIILFGFWRIREIRRNNRRESQLRDLELRFKESELAMLRNQMNPHFVFNALNSIQSYVLENDVETASGYIQKFSLLMRSSLEYSMDHWITLHKEIEFLKNYLMIEKLRFPDRFEYEISYGRNLDPDEVNIPPLLIQPIVENCVKHAFQPNENAGKIQVHFEREGKGLKCVIEDNGIGIAKARTTSGIKHRSYGMDVVRNRLELLSTSEFRLSVEVRDLGDDGSGRTGTRVEIKIPIE